MTRYLLPLLIVLGCGCTLPAAEPFELTIGPGFTAEERAVIEERAHEWLSVGASLGRVRVALQVPEAGEQFVGHFADGLLEIHPETRGPMFGRVVLHELGHAAGAGHHEGRGTMHPFVTEAAPCITSEDLATAGLVGPGTCGGAGD